MAYKKTEKQPGDLIQSKDWNAMSSEIERLGTAKADRSDDNLSVKTLEVQETLKGGTNTRGALKIQTNHGYIQVGPAHNSWCHLITDRAAFYLNKELTVDTGLIGSYNEDLQLRTARKTRMTLKKDGEIIVGAPLEVQETIKGGANTRGALKIQNSHGYVQVGPVNGSYSHFYTDRPAFYMNKELIVDTGLIGSYNEDLQLRTARKTRMTLKQDGEVVVAGSIKVQGTVEAKAVVQPREEWQSVNFQDGWVNYSKGTGYNHASYFRDSQGVVHLRGLVKSGKAGRAATIFTLPDGYRPVARELFAVCTYPNTIGRVDVLTDGRVIPEKADSGWVSLDGLTFRASQDTSQEGWHSEGFHSGWRNYGNDYNNVGYFRDSLGIVHLRGLIKGGGGNTTIFMLPEGYRPIGRELFAISRESNTVGRVDVLPTGQVWAETVSSGWTSLDRLSFRSRYDISQEGWYSVNFQDGWVNYGHGYNHAGYFKDSQGIVHLRGLVKSGKTEDGTIFTLPEGYRPVARELFGACTAPATIGRVDVLTDGRVVPVKAHNSWVSLDGLTFRAA